MSSDTSANTASGPSTTSQSPHSVSKASEIPKQQQASIQSLPYEERIPKIWRHLVSSAANSMHKAEKAGDNSTQDNCRELNESVLAFLRTRIEFHRILGNVEAKLRGKAQEREALEGYVRTQPRLGKRKRQEEHRTEVELEAEIRSMAGRISEGSVPAP